MPTTKGGEPVHGCGEVLATHVCVCVRGVLPVSAPSRAHHSPGEANAPCAKGVLFLHSEPLQPNPAQHSKTLEEKQCRVTAHRPRPAGSGRTLPSAALAAPRLGQEVLQQGPVAARRGVGRCSVLHTPLQGRGRHGCAGHGAGAGDRTAEAAPVPQPEGPARALVTRAWQGQGPAAGHPVPSRLGACTRVFSLTALSHRRRTGRAVSVGGTDMSQSGDRDSRSVCSRDRAACPCMVPHA